jgi:mannose-6-phosphate isomerase-like protein (cupin superfamily)
MTRRSAVLVIRKTDAAVHELPDARFDSYVHPDRGSTELCAWRVEIAPHTTGMPHKISQEEVFLALVGNAEAVVDGQPHPLAASEVLVVPAGGELRLDNPGDTPFVAWVTTRIGLRAQLPDGSWISPPWVAAS